MIGSLDDDDFLSLVDAAEAKATSTLSAKRQKLSPPPTATATQEGSYMAALKGSHSSTWKQQQQELKSVKNRIDVGGFRSGGPNSALTNDGACFKCGMTGHWARDCAGVGGGVGGGGGGFGSRDGEDGDVAVKMCPCGVGNCVVLTSNTAKNPGRKFYRCPVKGGNGGCDFFEWCDSPATTVSVGNAPYSQVSKPAADFPCPCGAGSCVALVSKSANNPGRQYYRCPAQGNASCGFFKWCSDEAGASQPAFASKYQETNNYSSSQRPGERSSSTCFKCGQEGHWSRDCPQQSKDTYANASAKPVTSSGSGTCYKCGKSGHWSRQCPTQDLGSNARSFSAYNAS